jgi:hypothetical protein
MIDDGMMLKTRHLATQYGAGNVIVNFWRNSFHIYTRLGKVTVSVPATVTCSGTCTFTGTR